MAWPETDISCASPSRSPLATRNCGSTRSRPVIASVDGMLKTCRACSFSWDGTAPMGSSRIQVAPPLVAELFRRGDSDVAHARPQFSRSLRRRASSISCWSRRCRDHALGRDEPRCRHGDAERLDFDGEINDGSLPGCSSGSPDAALRLRPRRCVARPEIRASPSGRHAAPAATSHHSDRDQEADSFSRPGVASSLSVCALIAGRASRAHLSMILGGGLLPIGRIASGEPTDEHRPASQAFAELLFRLRAEAIARCTRLGPAGFGGGRSIPSIRGYGSPATLAIRAAWSAFTNMRRISISVPMTATTP